VIVLAKIQPNFMANGSLRLRCLSLEEFTRIGEFDSAAVCLEVIVDQLRPELLDTCIEHVARTYLDIKIHVLGNPSSFWDFFVCLCLVMDDLLAGVLSLLRRSWSSWPLSS